MGFWPRSGNWLQYMFFVVPRNPPYHVNVRLGYLAVCIGLRLHECSTFPTIFVVSSAKIFPLTLKVMAVIASILICADRRKNHRSVFGTFIFDDRLNSTMPSSYINKSPLLPSLPNHLFCLPDLLIHVLLLTNFSHPSPYES